MRSPNLFTKSSSRLGSRAVATSRSPDSSTASAMFRPNPLALPVTNHTLSINTSLCCLINRSFELCPQLGGCRPFPRSESSIEGIRILVAEQVRHLCDIDIRPIEILPRQFLARLHKQLAKSRTVVVDPPLQGPIA